MNGIAGSAPLSSAATWRRRASQVAKPWPGQVAAGVGTRDAVDRRDPRCTTVVVLEVGVEGLLDLHTHERRPARVPELAREHRLSAREPNRQVAEAVECAPIAGPGRLDELLRLAQTVSTPSSSRRQSSMPTRARKRPRQRNATGPAHFVGTLGPFATSPNVSPSE